MAIYLQKTFDLSGPPIPGSIAAIEGSQFIEEHLDSPPAGWNRPVAIDSAVFSPDLTDVTMLESVNSGSANK